VQPFYEMTLVRPWQWGIAILSAPGAAVPETLDASPVTATGDALVVKVRHAQDIDTAVFEGDWDWATATIRVRYLADLPESGESVVYDGVLHLVDGRLSIGDADGEVTFNSLDDVTRVRVQVLDDWGGNAADVRVDLAPRT
jgi:hypothetical protein